MNKKELIDSWSHLPDDIEIILASDSEGNSFSPAYDHSVEYYLKSDFDAGRTDELFSREDVLDDSEDGQIPSTFTEVLVIWPV